MHSGLLVPNRLDRRLFHHKDGSSLWRSRAVDYALWHGEPLMGVKDDRFTLKVNQEPSTQNEEELILSVVLMPVKFPMENPESHDRVIDLTEGLIGPLLLAGCYQVRHVNQLQAAVHDIKVYVVVLLSPHVRSPVPLNIGIDGKSHDPNRQTRIRCAPYNISDAILFGSLLLPYGYFSVNPLLNTSLR